jgi:hypothetical protein
MTMQAKVPGPHPAYLHALSDLRAARPYLNDGWRGLREYDDDAVIREIDAAINEIKKASIDDGKGLNDPFRVDAHLSAHDRFRHGRNCRRRRPSSLRLRPRTGRNGRRSSRAETPARRSRFAHVRRRLPNDRRSPPLRRHSCTTLRKAIQSLRPWGFTPGLRQSGAPLIARAR